jgi:hypothetical protein
MNDLLTPLAILGIVVFGVLVALVAILFLQQAVGVARVLRGSRTSVRFAWRTKPCSSPPPWLEPEGEPSAPDEKAEPSGDVPSGWGFDEES